MYAFCFWVYCYWCYSISVELVLPDGENAKGVTYSGNLGDMQPVSFDAKGKTVSFTLPSVDIYGLAIVAM